jgi:hypothetical protein
MYIIRGSNMITIMNCVGVQEDIVVYMNVIL